MKLWRICFYCCAGCLSFSLSILNIYMERPIYDEQFNQQQLQQQRQNHNGLIRKSTPQTRRRKSIVDEDALHSKRSSNVVAPWTRLHKDNNNNQTLSSPRSFVFVEMKRFDSDYGVKMTNYDQQLDSVIKHQLEKRLCQRSQKYTDSHININDSLLQLKQQHQQTNTNVTTTTTTTTAVTATATTTTSSSSFKCKRNVEILKCSTCSEQDGTWYTAVSQTGAVFGQVMHDNDDGKPSHLRNNNNNNNTNTTNNDNTLIVKFPNYNDGPYMYQQLDIGIPIALQDEKLKRFIARIGPSIKKFRSGLYGCKVTIRILITRFSFESPSYENNPKELETLRQNLTAIAHFTKNMADEIIFVPVYTANTNTNNTNTTSTTGFSRAKAINAIHNTTYHNDNTVLAVIDVDLSVSPKYLRNTLTFPFPQRVAYFPIMFSQYNPQSTRLVDEFIPKTKYWTFSEHHGQWRKFSYGMYVMTGSDAKQLSMNEDFIGWGGEDNDFFARVSNKLNIIRLHESGLKHVWHPKHCDINGGFVKNKYFRECIASMSHFEGSQLGMYLMYLKQHDKTTFDEIMLYSKGLQDVEEKDTNTDVEQQYYDESPNILVGVVSSRENFSIRVKAIMKTWGDPQNVPESVTMRFFVGEPIQGNEFYNDPDGDVAYLADQAGITDSSMIVVMNGVIDNEYPPVRKNTAMIESMERIVQTYENNIDAPSTFQWIYKVDDDAYVNFDGMLSFIRTRNYDKFSVYGERGIGRQEDRDGLKQAGLVKPYCTGGPGYIMSRRIVNQTAPNFKDCVRKADQSPQRKSLWHSDSVIGLCVYNSTGAGCWDENDYFKNRIFRHNLHKEDPFIEQADLPKTIATHPFKDEISMTKQHERYVQLASTL